MAPSPFLNLVLNPLRVLPVVLTLLLLTACGPVAPSASPTATLPTETLTLNGRALTVELALDPSSREQGLSDRDALADDRGMLFVFPRERHLAFVMRRCHFDIDIAFIDASGEVVATHQMLVEPPETDERDLTQYSSHQPALMALELNAGGLERYGLTPGVRLDLPVLSLKRRARQRPSIW